MTTPPTPWVDGWTAIPRGRLTGVLRETAIEPVSAALRSLAPSVTPDDLVRSAYGLASVGLTGIGAMVSTDAGYWACAEQNSTW